MLTYLFQDYQYNKCIHEYMYDCIPIYYVDYVWLGISDSVLARIRTVHNTADWLPMLVW